MESRLLELPGELRNIIYEYCFDIQYDLLDDSKSPKWSMPPRTLIDLFLVSKQIYRESSTLFYLEVFPSFEYRAVSFIDLHRFSTKVPPQYRGTFKAAVSVLLLDGLTLLQRIGLGSHLPWVKGSDSQDDPKGDIGPVLHIERRLRGDCFTLNHYGNFSREYENRHNYDRIKMTGHLGRLQWTMETPPRIIFRLPVSKDEPPSSAQMSFGFD